MQAIKQIGNNGLVKVSHRKFYIWCLKKNLLVCISAVEFVHNVGTDKLL